MNYNRIIIGGHLTRDPQLKYLPNDKQTAVCECGIAVNHRYGDKEEVCFVDFVLFGKQAEAFNQYMSKGRPVLIEGRLKLESWTNQEGQKRSKHKIVADRFVFVGSKGDAQASAATPADAPPTGDDIPF
jgi:single-strand DNA-binding protein